VRFEDLPALTEQEEAKLVEVKDKELLTKINPVVPGTLKTVADTLAVAAHKKAGPVYRAIIPKGATLDTSKEMKDAVRATFRDKLGRIMGQANLVEDKTAELTYALNLGKMSKENCFEMYRLNAMRTEDTLRQLNEWHEKNAEQLEIDTKKNRRKRQGIEGVLMTLPGLLDNDLNYIELKEETVAQIKRQVAPVPVMNPPIGGDYYQEDVHLIAKDGKLFYLPQQSVG
jgi:hypothetical protein